VRPPAAAPATGRRRLRTVDRTDVAGEQQGLMRLGIVSDIHCNAAALRLALARMGDVDELLCVGDAIHEYRFGNDVVEILRDRQATWVLGNHELGLLHPLGVRAREAAHVRRDLLDHMASRPLSVNLTIDGCSILMTHASPLAPHTQYVHPRSADLRALSEVPADVVILGHTHVQMAEQVGRVLVVNPGSVGEPRDHANGRRYSYGVFNTSSRQFLVDNFDDLDEASPPAALSAVATR
jgi:putative phosphoesterase